MNPEIVKFLRDVKDSIGVIDQHLKNTPDFSAYENDIKTQDAVLRRLFIIGEALWQVNKIVPDIEISNKKKIIGLRHILIHDYDVVEDETIWVICKKHLFELDKEVAAILDTK